MELLKRNNWWIWLILWFFGSELIKNVVLAALLKNFDPDQWYAKWWVWVLGFVFFIFPFFVMILVFSIQLLIINAQKLEVPGAEIYTNPYLWIIGVIVPILGWMAIAFMSLYLTIMTIAQIASGVGEKYIVYE